MIVLASLLLFSSGSLTPTNLRCEYLTNPLGLEETQPRLSWVDTSAERGVMQSAYRILVASSPQKLKSGAADLWDSGKIASDQSAQIAYGGTPLQSREAAYWKVQVWDDHGGLTESHQDAWWEMGFLSRGEWQAKWIGLNKQDEKRPSLEGASWLWFPETLDSGDMPKGSIFLKKDFQIDSSASVQSAVLAIAADDHFKLIVNGKPAGAGDGWQTIHPVDIKPFLKPGANDIVVEGINDESKAGVAAIATVHFANGPDLVIPTDASWKTAKHLGDAWQDSLVLGSVGIAPWGQPKAPISNGPAPYIRKSFSVDSPVVRARAYVSALGLYRLYINGKAVGNDYLRPGWTDYKTRVQYETYDVTSMLKKGPNAVGIVLGNGWYCGRVGWTLGQNYGTQALGLVQLELQHADGAIDKIASDGTWKAGTGPIRSDDLLNGETFDARKANESWSTAAFDDSSWAMPLVQPLTDIAINAQQSPSVQKLQEIKPLTINENPKGSYIFDLGQNMVGWARLKVQGPAGTSVRLRFAEMLQPDGSIYTTNLRSALATDTYVLKGSGIESYEPTFTFHGFRYVEVTGYPGVPGKDAITGVVVSSNNPRAGEFECSAPLLNKLYSNINWGQKGNYLDVPTDCPQRDERLGWMGDAQIFVRTATFDSDIAAFMTKWTRDVDDAQSPEGGFSDVSPRLVDDSDGAPAWGDAGVIVPWTIYQAYGDKRILAVHYPAMAKWNAYVSDANPDHLWVHHANNNFGDWLNVQDDTPRDVIGTAYFAHSTDLLAQSAAILGKGEDAAKYQALLAEIKKAFNDKFVAADGTIKGDTQTDYVLALSFGLLPPEMQGPAIKKLSDHILIDRKGHLSTGFVGVGYLCPTLTKFGRIDVAYKLINTDTYPSWGYSIRQGATTIWERWDGWRADKGFQDPGMNSFNHYSLGSVGEWMMNWIVGIDLDPADPGFHHILLHPVPGGGLTYAKGSLNTIHGLVKSAWKLDPDGAFTVDVTVPANTHATLSLPAADADRVTESGRPAATAPGVLGYKVVSTEPVYELGGGTYHFKTTIRR